MKHVITAFITLLTVINAEAQKFPLDTLMYSGRSENRIDIVILSDGYTESQLSDFVEDAEKVATHVFNTSPFMEYKNYFNVFTISVPSNESGAAMDPDSLIDNYFGSSFNTGGIKRALSATRHDKVEEVLNINFPSYDQVLIIVNSSESGGTAGIYATFSAYEGMGDVAVHELGHTLGQLGDEYWYNGEDAMTREYPNMTRESSVYRVKWKNWINEFGIGLFAFAKVGIYYWYRPHQKCIMQVPDKPFCVVCREQLVRRMQEFVSPIDQYAPISTESEEDLITFKLTLVTPEPNTIKTTWFLDEEKIDENRISLDLNISELTDGNHTLKVNVYDSTLFDRRDKLYVHSVWWDINSSITSDTLRILERRSKLRLITSIASATSKFKLSAFPNPMQKKLSIEYEIDDATQVELFVINSRGEKVSKTFRKWQSAGKHSYELETNTYQNGLYLLVFKSGPSLQTVKLIKQD